MYHLLLQTLQNLKHEEVDIVFKITDSSKVVIPKQKTASVNQSQSAIGFLNKRYSFETFIVGPSNRLAFNAAKSVAASPGTDYNPLFLYSDTGLGKTHLLHSIARESLKQNMKCLYVTSEQFTNDFISSVRNRSMDQFRTKYADNQILLFDDIQFIGGKEQTQASFFHIFNELYNAGCQLVITSDSPPNSIPLLESRLRSRFGWGLPAKIEPPALETRLSILQHKAQKLGSNIDGEILEYIANRVLNNIRALEGTLTNIVAISKLTSSPITREIASQTISNLISSSVQTPVHPDAVLKAVQNVFNVNPSDIVGRDKHKEVATARQVTMYLMYNDLGLPISRIGRILGGKNHSTILHGIKNISLRINVDSKLRSEVFAAKESLARRI